MKLIIEDLAMEFAKTLVTSDQRELLEAADAKNLPHPRAVAAESFDLGEAFLAEYNERYRED